MGKLVILDAVLGLLSRNFCRTVISPSLRLKEADWIDLALDELKNSLSFLVTGADQEVAVFLKKLRDDLHFTAPELGPEKIHDAFQEFRGAIIAKGFWATCPIDAGKNQGAGAAPAEEVMDGRTTETDGMGQETPPRPAGTVEPLDVEGHRGVRSRTRAGIAPVRAVHNAAADGEQV